MPKGPRRSPKAQRFKVPSPPSLPFQLSLEKVIGTTTRHNSSFAVNPSSEEYAYVAASVVVVVNPKLPTQKQTTFLTAAKAKAVTCLAYSSNGKFLAVGEVRFSSSSDSI